MMGVRFFPEGNLLESFHTYKDLKLRWIEPYAISYPEAKIYEVDIPGADGSLDLTESLTGAVRYKNRQIELIFESQDKDYFEYEKTASRIASLVHGRRLNLILDTDPDFFYVGRFKLNRSKSSKIESTFVISGDVDPYKYENYDPMPILIDSQTNYTVEPLGILQALTVWVSNAKDLTVGYVSSDTDYVLHNGENEIPYIEVGLKPTELLFKGKGTVIVQLKKGAL